MAVTLRYLDGKAAPVPRNNTSSVSLPACTKWSAHLCNMPPDILYITHCSFAGMPLPPSPYTPMQHAAGHSRTQF